MPQPCDDLITTLWQGCYNLEISIQAINSKVATKNKIVVSDIKTGHIAINLK